jgi:RNA polymerase sigma factor (TIGR02999 family)
VALIHDDLKRLAHRHLAGNRWVATLNTTSVVNEAYLRLISPAARHVSTRLHFLNLASRMMRQIICDYARKRLLVLSNRGELPEPDDSGIDVDAEYQQASQLAELDNALEKLAQTKARHAEVVNCRFFAGYSEEETAEVLNISLRTVQGIGTRRAHGWRITFATSERQGCLDGCRSQFPGPRRRPQRPAVCASSVRA